MIRAAPVCLCLLAAGCFATAQDDPFQPTTGSIAVTLRLPPGTLAKVTLHGPAGFTKLINESVVLDGLQPGDYSFEAPAIVLPTSIIDTVYAVELPEAPFKLGIAKSLEVKLEYKPRPGSGSLWMTRFNDTRLLGGWPADTLTVGTRNASAETRLLTSYANMLAFQLDPQGGIWLLAEDVGVTSFVYFSAKTMLPGESQPTPRVMVAGERLLTFAFDAAGGVWCITRNGYLAHYTAAQLAAGDLAQADVILHGAAGSLAEPAALAFDAVGNLWVSDAAGSLNRFSPRQLAASSYSVPTARLTMTSPGAIVFDAAGSAWVASGGTLLRFAPAQLDGAADPADAFDFGEVVIHSFAFDALGELWATYTGASGSTSLGLLTRSQLAKAGVKTPFVALATDPQRGGPSLLLINPSPPGTPLYGTPR